jgi:hypothetical protein
MNAIIFTRQTGRFGCWRNISARISPGIKYALAGECFGWVYSKAFDREVPIKPHSSDWTVEDSKYFVDWVIPWAAREHGVLIPLPGEVL